MHTAIDACCVTGASLAHPIALVTLIDEARPRASDPRLRGALERSLPEHLERVNETLDPHERLDRLVVVADPWTVGTPEWGTRSECARTSARGRGRRNQLRRGAE